MRTTPSLTLGPADTLAAGAACAVIGTPPSPSPLVTKMTTPAAMTPADTNNPAAFLRDLGTKTTLSSAIRCVCNTAQPDSAFTQEQFFTKTKFAWRSPDAQFRWDAGC